MKKVYLIIFGVAAVLSFSSIVLINHFVAIKIDNSVQEIIGNYNGTNDIKIDYDDLSFNVIQSQVTFHNPTYLQGEDLIQSEFATIHIGLFDLIASLSNESEMSVNNATIGLQQLSLDTQMASMSVAEGTCTISATVDYQTQEVLCRKIGFNLKEFELASTEGEVNAHLLDFMIDLGENGTNLESLTIQPNESIVTLDEILWNFEIQNLAITLDEISAPQPENINFLQADRIRFDAHKANEQFVLDCQIETTNGEADLNCSFALESINDDPILDVSIDVRDISKELRSLLQTQIGWNPEKETYTFEYEGKISEIGMAFMMSLM